MPSNQPDQEASHPPDRAADYKINQWVSFLRQYGPIPRNDNMYDESIQRVLRRTDIPPLRFETGDILNRLISDISSQQPSSVVLTGTAGDGKTYLCRETWLALGGEIRDWNADGKIKRIKIAANHKKLLIIKDLSELRASDYKYLERIAQAAGNPDSDEVFLVAANDGQLVEAFTRAGDSPSISQLRILIEDLLVTDSIERPAYRLRLYNLSRTSSSAMMERILESVKTHPGWSNCIGCAGQSENLELRCPIWENLQRLSEPVLNERLHSLLRLCDQDGFHLPIRQLLILASNLILGSPDAKDGLLQCRDIPQIVQQKATPNASIYRNAFGANLSADRRTTTEVFSIFGRFGIGDETSNQIDSLLIFGADDPKLKTQFDRLIRSDRLYGANPQFLSMQAEYLEGSDDSEIRQFVSALPSARQRLFFTIPNGDAKSWGLWELTVFHFAGEYLEHVLTPLQLAEKPSRQLLDRLVRGINRVFTGVLVSDTREIVLTSSSSYSQSKVSRIQEHSISVQPDRGQKVVFEIDNGRPYLAVYLDRDSSVRLPLNLIRYEFLSRVADGALPTSFSRECYEDLLSFKTRLLQKWHALQKHYGEDSGTENEVTIRVIELDQRGALVHKSMSLKV